MKCISHINYFGSLLIYRFVGFCLARKPKKHNEKQVQRKSKAGGANSTVFYIPLVTDPTLNIGSEAREVPGPGLPGLDALLLGRGGSFGRSSTLLGRATSCF